MNRTLLLVANDQTFAIPLHAVTRVLHPGEASVVSAAESTTVRVGQADYPGIVLADHFAIPRGASGTKPKSAIWQDAPVLLLRWDDEVAALAVDRVLARRDVVVKPLGTHLAGVRGFLGGALLGADAIVPLLDPADFFRRGATQVIATASTPRHPVPAGPWQTLTVMAVNDSVRMRRVLADLIESQGWRA